MPMMVTAKSMLGLIGTNHRIQRNQSEEVVEKRITRVCYICSGSTNQFGGGEVAMVSRHSSFFLAVTLIVALPFIAAACAAPATPTPTSAPPTPTKAPAATTPPDAANATCTIERATITLSGGRAESPAAPGSATKVVTQLSDKQATGDLNGDGRLDIAVVLVHQPGGSGTFYYVTAVLNEGGGRGKATSAQLLGDRIAVEKASIEGGKIVVDFLTRGQNEPMAAPPTVKATKKFTVSGDKLTEVQ